MSRTRLRSDAELLAQIAGWIAREGPDRLTFARAAEITGLAAATLVQRFSTRDRLLQACLLQMWDELEAATAEADRRAALSEQGAVDLLLALSGGHEDADPDPGQGLLLLREDIRDPLLRARATRWHDQLLAALARRLGHDRPELRARLLCSQWQGAIIWWNFRRDGRLGDRLREELGAGLGLTARA